MTNRERALAILRYKPYDRLPLVHFGFWRETLHKWASEGHINKEEAEHQSDGNEWDCRIAEKLGFDFNWNSTFAPAYGPRPLFETAVINELEDGTQHIRNGLGVTVLSKPDAGSIPAEINHLLKDRASWEEHYKWRYEWSPERADADRLKTLLESERNAPLALFCGSLFGNIRNVLGLEGASYLMVDDEDLFDEIIETIANLSFRNVKYAFELGGKFDYAHFWEDICFKNGPLISPTVFREKIGPHYKRITDELHKHGIDIVSVDCDGWIDALVPIWVENGVNTMFPIEVGTWNGNIKPWREQFGRELRGVGGMNKKVFAHDKGAIDEEIERLKPLIDLGGFIPCPDHRIAPDAKWELVCYYCEKMRTVYG